MSGTSASCVVHPWEDTDISLGPFCIPGPIPAFPYSCLSLPPSLWMGPCDGWETKHYCSGMMFFKLDICCLFGWEFGKCCSLLWWSDLEEIIRQSWQPASQEHHSDAKERALNRGSRCPLCYECSGLRFLSRASGTSVLKVSQQENEIFNSIWKEIGPEIQRAPGQVVQNSYEAEKD